MSSSPSPYSRPLDPARSEIRLLELVSPDHDPGPVRCRLRTVSLADDPPEFCALSYVWGDARATTEVLVERDARPADGSGPEYIIFHATVNLEAALRHVRGRWAAHRNVSTSGRSRFLLWADAVCINQADLGERSRQVELMRQIFSSADLVLAWLGPQDLSLAFQALEDVASERASSPDMEAFLGLGWLRSYPALCEESDTWRQVLEFLRLPYWTRIWIFQETALARELLFVTPNHSIPFRTAWSAAWSMVHVNLALWKATATGSVAGRPGWLSQFSWRCLVGKELPWDDFVYASWVIDGDRGEDGHGRERQRRDGHPARGTQWAHWEAVLLYSMKLHATDPKDHVYGLLGVCHLDIKPDYTEATSLGDVYRDFVVRWLRDPRTDYARHKPLTFLCCAGSGLGSYSPALPSWVPNFYAAKYEYRLTRSGLDGRADRDVFACGTPTAAGEGGPHIIINGSTLAVTGLVLEPVVSIQESLVGVARARGLLLPYLLEYSTRHPRYVSGSTILDAFVELVFHGGESMKKSYGGFKLVYELLIDMFASAMKLVYAQEPAASVMRRAIGLMAPQGDGDALDEASGRAEDLADDLVAAAVIASAAREDLVAEAKLDLDSAYAIFQHWRLFETRSGYLGVAPGGLRPGDEVCILKDCYAPVVLRRKGPLQPPGEPPRFAHVGAAFVAGLMDGEACEFVRDGRATPETLVLV